MTTLIGEKRRFVPYWLWLKISMNCTGFVKWLVQRPINQNVDDYLAGGVKR